MAGLLEIAISFLFHPLGCKATHNTYNIADIFTTSKTVRRYHFRNTTSHTAYNRHGTTHGLSNRTRQALLQTDLHVDIHVVHHP